MGGKAGDGYLIMGIKDKQTYGEYYWAMQVEAAQQHSEDIEAEMSGMSTRIISALGIKEYLPEEFSRLFSELESPAGAFLGDIGGRFVSEVADGAVSQAASPFFESMGYLAYQKAPTKKLTPQTTATLFARKKITEELFDERFRMGGYEPIEAGFLYDALRPFPPIPDWILWARYHGDPDNVWSTLEDRVDISPVDFPVWEWMGRQRLATLQVQQLFKRGLISDIEAHSRFSQIGWSGDDVFSVSDLSWTIPNAMLLVQGDLQQERPNDDILIDISKADIHPDYAQQYIDAILTKPSSIDLIAYELRQDPSLSALDVKLRKIGIHPDYTPVYKELAYQIPPVADIITMAVREAFTPTIAARFGQYEDFPPDFELWAAKKGLTKEWAERYWAAHWSLPSAQQGFEMLHRGVITRVELDMLLRALDVMPFWRERLTRIAYRRMTRVDIRRMYRVGVMTEAEVYEANLELGYNERDAKRMTEYTIKQSLQTQSKFTARDIVGAYVKRMINVSQARSLLTEMGVRDTDISYILSTADYKKQWEFTDNQIAGIRNLYKKGMYDDNKAMSELLKLNLPSEQVDVLMQQWFYDGKVKPTRTWTTAQTLGFLADKLISPERARKELELIGYDNEHIDIYLKVA